MKLQLLVINLQERQDFVPWSSFSYVILTNKNKTLKAKKEFALVTQMVYFDILWIWLLLLLFSIWCSYKYSIRRKEKLLFAKVLTNLLHDRLLALQDVYYEEQMGSVIDEMLLQVHILGRGYALKWNLSSENPVNI